MAVVRDSTTWTMMAPDDLSKVLQKSSQDFEIVTDVQSLTSKSLYYKALGDNTRLRIVALLAISELCLCQLVELLNVPTSTMTHHLQMLENGGVIVPRKEGKFTVYSLHPDRKESLVESLQSDT